MLPIKRVIRRQAGRVFGEEWYTCDRCGFDFPRSQVLVQVGLIVCRGQNTTNCYDLQGAQIARDRLVLPLEGEIPPLPIDREPT